VPDVGPLLTLTRPGSGAERLDTAVAGGPVDGVRERRRSRFRLDPSDVLVAVLLTIAVGLWWHGSRQLPLHEMTDVGLASILPPQVWIAYLLVATAFCVALRSGRTAAILASIATTVLVLHGLGVVAEPEMRFAVAWRHIGIADFIRTGGKLDPDLDAYQSWPGFFALIAFLWQATGLTDPSPVVAWTPVFYNLMYLPPLIAIGLRVTGNRTVTWLAAWLFTASNWIGQDYFSPQGWYLFVYLVVMAVLIEWFPVRPVPWRVTPCRSVILRWKVARWRRSGTPIVPAPDGPDVTRTQRTALLAIILLLVATMISSHQLTPFALTFGIGALVLVGWCRVQLLPVIVLLATLTWLGYGASAYVAGHGAMLEEQVGAVASIFDQTVANRLSGTPGHTLVVRLRLLETAALWLLAAAGAIRLVRGGRAELALGLGAAAAGTFPVLALQSYGGEALLRIAFFALPFMALLAAVALVGPDAADLPFRPLVAIALTAVVLVSVFPISRYGNERMDWYSTDQVSVVRQMYALAPPGSVLTSVTGGLPWRYTHYADYDYRLLVDGNDVVVGDDAGSSGSVDLENSSQAELISQVISRVMPAPGQRSFLIMTRSESAEIDLMGPFHAGSTAALERAVRTSAAFRPVATSPDAQLYEYVGGETT
jgi:hypothetical protein